MRVFFDTSALAKRYVEENGSEQVRALCAEALDALHVGSALAYQPDLFVSADWLAEERELLARGPAGEESER